MTNRNIALLTLIPIAGLVFAIATVVVVLSLPDDDAPEPVALAPTATAASVSTSTPVPTPTPPPVVFPPAPPVDTSRTVAAGQTTLLEVDTGRVLRWENGENVQNARFSPDGRWLVYNQGWIPGENDLINSRIYRIDLSAPVLTPQLIGVGFNPSISSRGDIAFNRQFGGQRANVYVARLDGSVQRLNAIGATFTAPSWSPDGRWLVFAAGYHGMNPMTITVVDIITWSERQTGEWITGPGDQGYIPQWSPDSRHFLHDRRYLTTAATGVVTPVQGAAGWLEASVYLQYETHPQTHFLTGAYAVDLTSGQRTKLFETSGDTHVGDYDYRGAGLLAFAVQDTRPNPQDGPIPPYFRITTFDGTPVIDKLPGQQLVVRGEYLLTRTGDPDGCNGTSRWRRDGTHVRCLGLAPSSVGPEGTIAYVKVERPATPQLRIATGDVYLLDIESGLQTLVLTEQEGGCLRWSPDYRWLVADDFCDTI